MQSNKFTYCKGLYKKMFTALALIIPAILSTGSVQVANAFPANPPVTICSNQALLTGPATAPSGAITVPAGDNSGVNFSTAGATYWFAPGTHTLGTGQYSQIAPGNNATFIGGPGAILDGQSKNQYAFTGNARGVTLEYLTITNFGAAYSNNNEGVVNHNSGTAWVIRYCTVANVEGAGVFIGDSNEVCCNCIKNNGQYGFSMYKPEGVKHIRLDSNEIAGNNTDNWEARQPGCGCTGGGKFWDVDGAEVRGNYVHDNKSVGLWADTDNRHFLFEGNYISDNDAEGIFYEISYNFLIQDNTFLRNNLVKGKARGSDAFPDGAIYISSSSGEAAVSSTYAVSEISGNYFKDNWNGVVMFEAPDRFCGSVANTSTGYCPLIDLNNAERRWYVRNVHIHDNVFEITKSNIGGAGNNNCGRNALLGSYGTIADTVTGQQYLGYVTATKETFLQNNKFYNNIYLGDWNFQAYSTGSGNLVSWNIWRAAPPPSSVLATASASVAGADALYGDMSYQKPPANGYGYGQDSGSTFSLTIPVKNLPIAGNTAMPSLTVSHNSFHSNIIRIDGAAMEKGLRITVLDMAGRLVADLSRNIVNNLIMWNAGSRRSGVYIVNVLAGNRNVSQKVILP
jgi:parallel beta-helix repeat protein